LPHFCQAQTFRLKQSIDDEIPFETVFRIKLKNGESKFINIKGIVENETNRNPEKLIGVCFDITAMKKGAENKKMKNCR
jgi:hypothetical protein